MIQIDNVWFKYDKKWVLKKINLELKDGEIVVVLGPNGAGKTTLLKIMGLLLRPSRGSILINGINPWAKNRRGLIEARRSVVYVHEKPILVKGRVIDNVVLGLKLRGVSQYVAINNAIATMKITGLEEIAEHDVRSLSIGQAQLVSITRAIAVKPKVLLLDEPFAHLDRIKRIRLVEILNNLALNERVTVVIATHDTLLASKIAIKAYYIEEGTISTLNKKELYELI